MRLLKYAIVVCVLRARACGSKNLRGLDNEEKEVSMGDDGGGEYAEYDQYEEEEATVIAELQLMEDVRVEYLDDGEDVMIVAMDNSGTEHSRNLLDELDKTTHELGLAEAYVKLSGGTAPKSLIDAQARVDDEIEKEQEEEEEEVEGNDGNEDDVDRRLRLPRVKSRLYTRRTGNISWKRRTRQIGGRIYPYRGYLCVAVGKYNRRRRIWLVSRTKNCSWSTAYMQTIVYRRKGLLSAFTLDATGDGYNFRLYWR